MDNTNGTNIINVDISKEMKDSFLAYSMSVIVQRALPDVRDGLKPVHRRILYTMHENGLVPEREYRKCADTVGSVLGRYHPHGDASVYDAMVRLAQDFSMRYPLVDGQGNFGSVDGDPAAAYRYTEARMSKISTEMLTDIDKDTIDYQSNYDDRLKEPVVLPSRYPNLLVNGSMGIAVGMATNIPPHNLGEVIDAIDMLMENPEADLNALMTCVKGPDFPTAGIIMGKAGIRSAYATGRGKIILRARTEIEEIKPGKMAIIITELPYGVNKARLQEHIANLVKEKRIEGITDMRDETDRDGMRVVIELRRDANPQIVLNNLFNYTQMQDTVGVIMLALVDGQPKVLSLKEMLQEYIKFQKDVIRRRTIFELKKARERAHILEGLKVAQDNIEEVIRIIRSHKTIQEGKEALMERFGFSDAQASAIVAMRIGQLAGLEREKIEEELRQLMERIAYYESVLADEHLIEGIIRDELAEIRKKFGDERRTEIQSVSGEVDIEDLIPDENSIVTLTHAGYIKRQATELYKTQKRGGRGVSGVKNREEDFVKDIFTCTSHDSLLLFSNVGKVYKLKCYELPEGNKNSKGMNVVNLLPLDPEEKIECMIAVGDFEADRYITSVTKMGMLKRTKLSAYSNVRKNGLAAVGLNEGDELATILLTDGTGDLLVATANGKAIRFTESKVTPLSRKSRGVHAIRLSGDDRVVGMVEVKDEQEIVVTVTDRGYGRRSVVEEYARQGRGGMGILNYRASDVKGHVVGVCKAAEDEDMILISDDGIVIRIKSADIPLMRRAAGGVHVMRLRDEVRLVAFAISEHDEEQETQQVDMSTISEEENAVDESVEEVAEEVIDEAVEEAEDAENEE